MHRARPAHLGRDLWHCFRCGAGGNALDLWAAVTRQGVHAAVLDLCQRLGRDVPGLPRPRAAPAGTRARLPDQENDTMPDP